jgi:GMP synthase-like glutamine amidotransferase
MAYSRKSAILDWVSNDRGPYLGVCLGHQLLAEAMGGSCATADNAEIGILEINANESVTHDPVFGDMQSTLTCFQWHGVEVDNPPIGAKTLYSSDQCNCQIMQVGKRAYGVQFHPELLSETIPDWLGDEGNRQAIADWMGPSGPEDLIAVVSEHLPELYAQSGEIYRRIRVL